MTTPRIMSFTAGSTGPWIIERIEAVCGDTLPPADRLDMTERTSPTLAQGSSWRLSGFTAEARYATAGERRQLAVAQESLGRPGATRAALIPIRKSPAWWNLAQDERRAIFEDRSHHIAIGRDYLPAVARQLHHCRGLQEPFDFLTWFEYAPETEPAFDAMLLRLRRTEEWRYVEREVDIRVARVGSSA
jgi:chlorite dismutase